MRPSLTLAQSVSGRSVMPVPENSEKGPFSRERAQIPRIHQVIQPHRLQPLFHPAHHLRVGIVAPVDQADIGVALFADLQQLHPQAGGFHPAADHRHIDAHRLCKALPGTTEVVFSSGFPHRPKTEALDPQGHPFGTAVHKQHCKPRCNELDQFLVAVQYLFIPGHEQLLTKPLRKLPRRNPVPGQDPVQVGGRAQNQGLVADKPLEHDKGQSVPLDLQAVDLQIRCLPGECSQFRQGILQMGIKRPVQSRIRSRDLIPMPQFPLKSIKQQNHLLFPADQRGSC